MRLSRTDSTFQLRDYQQSAINFWRRSNWRGILAMATGTGKTFTALQATAALRQNDPELATILIVAPFQHLADQWSDELQRSAIRPVKAYESSARWLPEWTLELHRARAMRRPMYVITTYATLGTTLLLEKLHPLASNMLVIADECHYLGAEKGQGFIALPVPYRLGLSATPARHFDERGTRRLLDYFGGVVYSFTMHEAIDQGYLTPYRYYPEPVELTYSEFEEYSVLTQKIGAAAAFAEASGDTEGLERLLHARARLLNNSVAKLDWLRQKLVSRTPNDLRYTLIYVGDILFKSVLEMIGQELQVPVHAFTAAQTRAQRADILKRFETGELSMLVAMRCLDEGVDVPPTRTAYFLASTSNPREFVQRRGRILRRAAGKEYASIHDAIALPPRGTRLSRFDRTEQATVRSQFSRIQEFSRHAQNRHEADSHLFRLRLAADLPLGSETTGEKM